MDKNGDIIIKDDEDDQFLLEQAFESLEFPNIRKYFLDGQTALDYLLSTKDLPFLILSDINLPVLNGFELRSKLYTDAELNLKCIPYLFSTAINHKIVIDAYNTSAQELFVKQTSFDELVPKTNVGSVTLYLKPARFLPQIIRIKILLFQYLG